MIQDELRREIKLLKALQGINYKEISEYLDITQNSLYNFLRGQFNLSDEKVQILKDIISCLKEGDT